MRQQWPRTLQEAVRISILTMADKEKEMLRNTPEEDLVLFHYNWAMNMRNEFGLWHGNDELLESCGESGADGASMALIRAVWEALKDAE